MSITDIIKPEIKDDELYHYIARVGSTMHLRHILEIGSSSGGGSTEAWVKGIKANPDKPILHLLYIYKLL